MSENKRFCVTYFRFLPPLPCCPSQYVRFWMEVISKLLASPRINKVRKSSGKTRLPVICWQTTTMTMDFAAIIETSCLKPRLKGIGVMITTIIVGILLTAKVEVIFKWTASLHGNKKHLVSSGNNGEEKIHWHRNSPFFLGLIYDESLMNGECKHVVYNALHVNLNNSFTSIYFASIVKSYAIHRARDATCFVSNYYSYAMHGFCCYLNKTYLF